MNNVYKRNRNSEWSSVIKREIVTEFAAIVIEVLLDVWELSIYISLLNLIP